MQFSESGLDCPGAFKTRFCVSLFFCLFFSPIGSSYSSKDGTKFEGSSSTMLNSIKHQKMWETSQRLLGNHTPCNSKNCSCFFQTLDADLKPFHGGVTKKMFEAVKNRGTRYVVYGHKLYRSKECSFPARCSGVEHFLIELIPKLPDVEFILNPRDWPQISRHFGERGPVFSFSKTREYLDIHYPAWSFWEGGPAIKSYPRGLGRWDTMSRNLLKESEAWPWGSKIEKGFFRGSRTSEERDALVLLSRNKPDIVDAQYTKNQAWKSPADTLQAEPADEVPLEQHCRYKFLFNFRGVAASFRFKHLFLCGSLVIHFGDEWTEFFYDALQPWVHYVPMSADSTENEILSMLEFLREHDELASEIARRGQEFIRKHLRMKDVSCYWRTLLRRYSKLIKYPITLDDELEELV